MRILGPIAATAMLLTACGSRDNGSAAPGNETAGSSARQNEAPAAPGPTTRATQWDLQSSGEGVALALLADSERASIRLYCPAGQDRLLVNVADFRPVGSEERLSIGSGGEAHALVADPRGDRQRGGVSGTGAVPDRLPALVAGPLSASYGAQRSGPHAPVPPALVRAFVAACHEGAAMALPPSPRPDAPASMQPLAGGACLMQDGERLRMTPLRAVGTEPFWGARIEGRCVTYSHPEDQKGTRIWTRYTPGPDGGIWTGALGGRRFELRTRSAAACSDGMSDRKYPFEVELLVSGERRTGCAEPSS